MRLSTPARADEVATMCGSGCNASSEFTQTIDGAFAASRSIGRKARVGRITLKYFRSSSSRQASSVVSAKVETRPWPALFTSMSVRPKRSGDLRGERGDVVGIEHVAARGEQLRFGKLRRERRLRCVEPLRVAPANRHRCARPQEQFGRREADAGRAARHHRHLACEIDLDHCNPNDFMYLLVRSRGR